MGFRGWSLESWVLVSRLRVWLVGFNFVMMLLVCYGSNFVDKYFQYYVHFLDAFMISIE